MLRRHEKGGLYLRQENVVLRNLIKKNLTSEFMGIFTPFKNEHEKCKTCESEAHT